MYQMTLKQDNQIVESTNEEIYKKLLMLGAVGGILIGTLSSFIGIVVSLEIFIAHLETHRLEIVFLIFSFGFFALGAHCMDKIDKLRKKKRVERYRNNWISNENRS